MVVSDVDVQFTGRLFSAICFPRHGHEASRHGLNSRHNKYQRSREINSPAKGKYFQGRTALPDAKRVGRLVRAARPRVGVSAAAASRRRGGSHGTHRKSQDRHRRLVATQQRLRSLQKHRIALGPERIPRKKGAEIEQERPAGDQEGIPEEGLVQNRAVASKNQRRRLFDPNRDQ